MASNKEYLTFILDQLRDVKDVTWRAMMGEYILYGEGKIFGGIYDDRFLVKDTPVSGTWMPNAEKQIPYEGAKPMLLVEDVDNSEFLSGLITAMCKELPEPAKRRKLV